MKLGSLRVGQDLTLNGVSYRLIRIIENEHLQLERSKDLALISRSKSELLAAMANGDLSLCSAKTAIQSRKSAACDADLASLPLIRQKEALRRYCYVKEIALRGGEKPAMAQFDAITDIVAARLEDKCKPTPITVYRWWRHWQNTNCDLLALAQKPRKKDVQRKFRGIVAEEIHKVINEICLSPEKNTCQNAYEALCHELNLLNKARSRPLTIPSRSTFYRICATYDNYEVMAARKGRNTADRHFRTVSGGVAPQYI